MSLDKDTLNEMFRYENGKLYRRFGISGQSKGSLAGCKNDNGYIVVSISNKSHKAHRLIYIMHYGHIPQRLQIDHINGVRDDNRIENLRPVTSQENKFNKKDIKGYTFCKRSKKYISQIKRDGKVKYLGSFHNKEEAREAYLLAKKSLHIINDRK